MWFKNDRNQKDPQRVRRKRKREKEVNKAGHDVNIHTISVDKCKKLPLYASLHYRSKGLRANRDVQLDIFLLNPKPALMNC